MSQNILKCPACGSTSIDEKTEKRKVQAPFGQEIEIEESIIYCHSCNDEYKMDDSDKKYVNALTQSTKSSISSIIEYITNLGYSFTEIERSLDIPFRTFSRWKSTRDIAAPTVTLLRFLRTYPWLIEVADKKFNEVDAKTLLVLNAYKVLNNSFENYFGITRDIQVEANSNTLKFTQEYEKASLHLICKSSPKSEKNIYLEQNNF